MKMIEIRSDMAGVYLVAGALKSPATWRRHLLSIRNGDGVLARYRAGLAAIKNRPRHERPRTVEEIVRMLKEGTD